MNGRSIRIFLPEGNPGQLFTAEIVNWTGRVTIFPRAELNKFKGRSESQQPGVYILLGQNPEHPEQDLAYIGETEVLIDRLKQHDGSEEKDFWQTTFAISSKDANLTKAHIRYLENKLIQSIFQVGRVKLKNGTLTSTSQTSPLPEADRADMDYFLTQLSLLLPMIGFDGTRRRPTVNLKPALGEKVSSGMTSIETEEGGKVVEFEIRKSTLNLLARAVENAGEFIVLAGSMARKEAQVSWTNYRQLRLQLEDEGKLIPDSDPLLLVFKEDITFRSPSAAASVILAMNANGRTQWVHTYTGQEYGAYKTQQIDLKISDDL